MKKLIFSLTIISLIAGKIIAGQVPTGVKRVYGNVSDSQAKTQLGQIYRVGHLFENVASGATATFLIDASTETFTGSEFHETLAIVSEGQSTLRIFKNPVISSSGTAVTAFNMNDAYNDTIEIDLFHTPVIISSGTIISPSIVISTGTTFHSNTDIRIGTEHIGISDNTYLYEITNNSADPKDIGLYFDIFEVE